jgi:hypothetical protein
MSWQLLAFPENQVDIVQFENILFGRVLVIPAGFEI